MLKQQWAIQPKENAAFVANMEVVLDSVLVAILNEVKEKGGK